MGVNTVINSDNIVGLIQRTLNEVDTRLVDHGVRAVSYTHLDVYKRQTLLVVLIYYFINRITRPVGQLHAAAEKVRTGDFAVEVDIHTNDELEILGDSFNSMVQDLQNLLEESVEHEKNIREMEINRLMLQINPHFIYNTPVSYTHLF